MRRRFDSIQFQSHTDSSPSVSSDSCGFVLIEAAGLIGCSNDPGRVFQPA